MNDPEVHATLLRAQEIPIYAAEGILDCGITGWDNVEESEADVLDLGELGYSKSTAAPYRWVLAVPEDSPIRSVQDLQGKRIATELVNVTRRYLAQHGVEATVKFSWGATEVKAPELADAIVEGTETGATLRAHRLQIIDEVMQSTTRWIANRTAADDPWKRAKMANILLLLRGALAAEGMVGLKMNVATSGLPQVLAILPAMKRPTISPLADAEWVALETIIGEVEARELIPALKQAGAEGIVEYPLNKVIP